MTFQAPKGVSDLETGDQRDVSAADAVTWLAERLDLAARAGAPVGVAS